MAAVVASLARIIFQRQRDRLRSDRVDSHVHEDDEEESDRSIENNNNNNNNDDVIVDEEEGSFLSDQQSGSNTNSRTQDESESSNTNDEGVQSFVARTTITLAELEEEVSARQQERYVFLFLSCLTTHSTILCLFRAVGIKSGKWLGGDHRHVFFLPCLFCFACGFTRSTVPVRAIVVLAIVNGVLHTKTDIFCFS
jgi:hypothetical protein